MLAKQAKKKKKKKIKDKGNDNDNGNDKRRLRGAFSSHIISYHFITIWLFFVIVDHIRS
jgi:hypothetical protein